MPKIGHNLKFSHFCEDENVSPPIQHVKSYQHFHSELPLENWADLLPFVPRRQLVKLLLQIDNYHFTTIIEYVLNEVGQISLGQLHILSPKKVEANGGAIVEMRKHFVCQNNITNLLDLLDLPLPKNATTFQSIKLSHFDSSVLNLLHRFQQKSLLVLVNVNLVIWSELTKAKVEGVLAQILPIIGSIQAIWLCNTYWVHEFPQMATTMLARARILKITSYSSYQTIEWYCRWLYAPREDGAPRVLYIGYNLGERNAIQFIDHIKKDFSLAKLPITFFIHFRTCNFQWKELCLENDQSREKLVAKKTKANDAILVSRYPMQQQDVVKGWIEAMEYQVLEHEFSDRLIFLDNRLIIN